MRLKLWVDCVLWEIREDLIGLFGGLNSNSLMCTITKMGFETMWKTYLLY